MRGRIDTQIDKALIASVSSVAVNHLDTSFCFISVIR